MSESTEHEPNHSEGRQPEREASPLLREQQGGEERFPRQFDPQEIGRLFPSPESRKVFEQVDAATGGREGAIRHKKRTIIEIRNKSLIDQQILKENPVVYVGSGIDFEYPLLLGGRDIILVDPVLKDAEVVEELKRRITVAIGSEPTDSEGKLQFQFNSGTGNETISIKLEPAFYGTPEEIERLQPDEREVRERLIRDILEDHPLILESMKEEYRTQTGMFAPDYVPPKREIFPRFQPPEKIGMLLGFQFTGTDVEIDDDQETMNNIVNGGYVLANVALSSNIIRQLSDEEREKYIFSPSEQQLQIKQTKWRERGYELIPLETVGDTFIKKNVPSSPAS